MVATATDGRGYELARKVPRINRIRLRIDTVINHALQIFRWPSEREYLPFLVRRQATRRFRPMGVLLLALLVVIKIVIHSRLTGPTQPT